MENNVRFRNHFSIILPNLKGLLWLFLMPVLSALVGDDGDRIKLLGSFFIVLGIVIVILAWQILVWSKTWITMDSQSIVIECNTFLMRRKNTIGISNISNVNLEQGLMAMLLGTCKLKLDTNSLSTADATDVTIVLKKQAAEELRAFLMSCIDGKESMEETSEAIEVDNTSSEVPSALQIGVKEILLHGIFSSRFLYTIFVPLYILLELISEVDDGDLNYLIDEIDTFASQTVGLGILILIAFVAWAVLAMLFGLVKGIVKYWDFKIERKDDKLLLEYGLTNKVTYSIPVDKIQAFVFKQSMFARIFKYYTAEVVNVGMNDDKQEAQAFLLPYCNKKLLDDYIVRLLPEFADCLEMKAERQPRCVWMVWLWSVLLYLLVNIGILIGVFILFPNAIGPVSGAFGVIGIAVFIMKYAGYRTKGRMFGERILLSVSGVFSRKFVFMKYDKIQHICFKQNFIAKRYKMIRGTVSLLASAMNRVQELPYCREENVELLKHKLTRI